MEYQRKIEALAAQQLVGRKIVAVRYMPEDEADEYGWDMRGVTILLDDGVLLVPMRDDEGNGPGALATSLEGELSLFAVVQ